MCKLDILRAGLYTFHSILKIRGKNEEKKTEKRKKRKKRKKTGKNRRKKNEKILLEIVIKKNQKINHRWMGGGEAIRFPFHNPK